MNPRKLLNPSLVDSFDKKVVLNEVEKEPADAPICTKNIKVKIKHKSKNKISTQAKISTVKKKKLEKDNETNLY